MFIIITANATINTQAFYQILKKLIGGNVL